MRITCDRCGRTACSSETHAPQSDLPIRDIIKRMRHDGCGGRPGRAELLTGIEGASSRPVRKIALLGVVALAAGLLLAAVPGLSSATPAAAANNVHLIGAGMSSCEIWTADRTARNVDAVQDEQWVVGYLSGVAIWTPDLNPMKGVNAQAVWAWMDNYCREHPLVAIKDATSAFVEEHPGKN